MIERFIRTLKHEGTRRLMFPFRRASFLREFRLFGDWYDKHRPYSGLNGEIPEEMYRLTLRSEPCLKIDYRSEAIALHVNFLSDRRHLPIVTLRSKTAARGNCRGGPIMQHTDV